MLKKFVSRKLLILLLATALLFSGKMNDYVWLICAVFYMGANEIDKLIELKKSGG